MGNKTNPVWFITGCSTGLGRSLAEAVSRRGAGDQNPVDDTGAGFQRRARLCGDFVHRRAQFVEPARRPRVDERQRLGYEIQLGRGAGAVLQPRAQDRVAVREDEDAWDDERFHPDSVRRGRSSTPGLSRRAEPRAGASYRVGLSVATRVVRQTTMARSLAYAEGREDAAEHLFRHALPTGIYGGTMEVFRNMIAQHELKLGRPSYGG